LNPAGRVLIQIKEIADWRCYRLRHQPGGGDDTMPVEDIVVLGFVIGAFVVFSATLAWASWRERKPDEDKQRARQAPANTRHA
jgi:hypothetical protein